MIFETPKYKKLMTLIRILRELEWVQNKNKYHFHDFPKIMSRDSKIPN